MQTRSTRPEQFQTLHTRITRDNRGKLRRLCKSSGLTIQAVVNKLIADGFRCQGCTDM